MARCNKFWARSRKWRSIFAERVAEGFYINIEVNRAEERRDTV